MAWKTPKTWATDAPLDGATLNQEIRDNQIALHTQSQANAAAASLLSLNSVHRIKTIQADQGLNTDSRSDLFGSPTLDLTVRKSTAVVMAGIQVTLRDHSQAAGAVDIVELRLRCYQERTPTPYTYDVFSDEFIQQGGIRSLAVTSVFPGFNAGSVSFTVDLTAGSGVSLLTGSHLIWAMEL